MKKRFFSSFKKTRYITKAGIKIIYIHSKNIFTSIDFCISGGLIYKNNKYSPLCSNLIPFILKDNELFSFLLENQTTFSCKTNYLNTIYQFNSIGKEEEIILYFINRLNNLVISKECIDSFTKYMNNYFYDTNNLLQNKMYDNLFFSSPLIEANMPLNNIGEIEIDIVKNFYFDAYKKENIKIYITGPLNKKNILKLFDNLDNQISYFNNSGNIEKRIYSENYSSIKRNYLLIQSSFYKNYLAFGIKLPMINQLINRFDKFLIPYLYLTKYACFDLNLEFLSSVNNSEAKYISSYIDSSGIDSMFMIIFEGEKEEKITKIFNEYFSYLSSKVDKYVFNNAKRYCFSLLFDGLIHPNTIVASLNYQFNEILDYQKLVKLIKKIKYDEFISFLSYFSKFLKSVVSIKSN